MPLLQQGLEHQPTGIYGWEFKSDVGIEPIGNGYFYITRDFDDPLQRPQAGSSHI